MRTLASLAAVVGLWLAAPALLAAESDGSDAPDSSEAALEPPATYDPQQALFQSLGYTFGGLGVGGLLLFVDPSVGATVLGLSAAVGPGMGHIYADNWVRGVLMIGARLILAAAAVACTYAALEPEAIDSLENDGWSNGRKALLAGGLTATAATVALGVIDIVAAPEAARAANRELRAAQRSLGIAVAPTPSAGAGQGGVAAGIVGSF